jgi:hypothetical protein
MNFSVKFNVKIGDNGAGSLLSFLQDPKPRRRSIMDGTIKIRIFIGYLMDLISFAAFDLFARLKSLERLTAKEYLGVICVPK